MLKRTEEYAKPVNMTEKDCLETFYEKSKSLTPKCLGAYEKDDEVCTKYCACGKADFDSHDSASRDALNEPSGMGYSSFFYSRLAVPSCRQEASRFAKAVKDAEQNQARAVMERMSRGHYLETIRRVPIGPVRYGKRVMNLASMGYVHIGTRKNKKYLYKIEPYCGPLFNTTEKRLADIAEIRGRRQPTGSYIKVLSQEVRDDFLILTVKSANENSREVFGHRFKILVRLEEALVSNVRMDDIGALD